MAGGPDHGLEIIGYRDGRWLSVIGTLRRILFSCKQSDNAFAVSF
jgi:hypothetical protein